MKTTLTPFFITVFALTTFQLSAQSAWVPDAKAFYLQAQVSTFSSSRYFGLNGQLNEGTTFNSQAFMLYGEYGLTGRLTAIADLPVFELNSFSSTETAGGVGDLKLGLKYQLIQSFPVAVQVEAEIPTDDGVNFARAKMPNDFGTFDEINLPTSDGEFNVWTTLAVSHSTKGGTFASLFGSVNFRTQGFTNQWQSGLEIGHLFFEKFYLIGKLRVQGKLSSTDSIGASFLYGEGTTFTTFALNPLFKLNDHWLLVASFSGFTDWIVAKRNIYDGYTFTIGVAYERK